MSTAIRIVSWRALPWGRALFAACAAMLACATVPALAQQWEVFDQSTAGFPSNSVSAIEEAQGSIWVGTSFGLCRYDDGNWEILQSGVSGLPGNVVKCLAVDTADRLWVGTLLNGIGIYDGSVWEYLNTDNSPLPDNEINCITIDHRGWAWIGTFLGLVCYTGTEWRLYNNSGSSYNDLALGGNVVQDVQVRSDGLVAIGMLNGGFHYLTDTSVHVFTTYADDFPDNTQNAVVFDEQANERWLATPSQGLLRQGGDWLSGPWFKYTSQNSNIPSNAITCLKQDGSGRLWFGTLVAGLGIRDTDGTYSSYTAENSGLPENYVQRVLLASDGAVWAGTSSAGAARLTFPSGLARAEVPVVRCYPNPATDHVTIDLTEVDRNGAWRLHDRTGRSLMEGRISQRTSTIDIEALAPGLYLLEVLHSGRRQVIPLQRH